VAKDAGKWLTAADCAARTGLTVRALRVYERAGLLKPGRAANGWRRYGPDDLMRLNTISVLKGLGLTLAQIRNLLRQTDPSLLNVLRVQAKSWRERQAQAGKAIELVEAAIHRLERNQPPSLEELCQLVNALQARSTPMHNRATLFADLMKELLTSEEQWQWQSWWASHPEDANQNALYMRERAEGYAMLLDLQQQGAPPEDPAVQEQLLKQDALISKYGLRERTVRMMDWNLAVTTKIMELGAIARERHPDVKAMPYPLLSQELTKFIEAGINVSPSMRAVREVLVRVKSLIQADIEPTAGSTEPVVRELEAVCAQHGLEDPGVYVRYMPFMAQVGHRTPSPGFPEAFEFLAKAIRAHGRPAPTAAVAAGFVASSDDFTPAEVSAVRRAFARQLGVMAGTFVPRLEAAFAAVKREKFLGAGPWLILSMLRGTYLRTPDASPVHLYVDTAVSILKEKVLNNGQPSLYYRLLAETLVPEGARVVHVGAGTGYYTAVLGHLVGPAGTVTAIEYEPELAARARANLQDLPQVEVIQGDATQTPFAPADLILVSAGATHPVDHWLDGLKDGGQLVLPLTPDTGVGIVMGIRRRGERFFATLLSPIFIYRCAGARDPQSASALAEALKRGGQNGVTRLYRGDPPALENIWLQGENWCLA
jgi:protein-L-isoaspartate(D-aspartate) O-methyltransferase